MKFSEFKKKKRSILKHSVIITLVAILGISGCATSKRDALDKQYCKTRYPIILVHGLGFRDNSLLLKYWGDIPDALRRHGAEVHHGGQNAFSSHKNNAQQLKRKITVILHKTGSKKVNIIAHSKGGIESRYMITKLGMAHRVASLTTIATPHRGSSMAKIILTGISKRKILVKKIGDLYARLMGDIDPDSMQAGRELTREYMKRFNREVPDMPGVYYQSYGCVIDSSYPSPIWRLMYSSLSSVEGANDGLVSIESCRWGRFKGIVRGKKTQLVSHADIVGLFALTGVYSFNAREFYISIVHELKGMGF
ncbi:triacylglycerol lipase [bacterium]|nr:triacylglycerol lipase [bacterium]